MAKQALSKLNRKELLELMLLQSKEIDSLREEINRLHVELDERQVQISESGSLAEAVFRLNGVYAAAQKACDQYTENMQARCAAMEAETRERCEAMLNETKARCREYIQHIKTTAPKEGSAHENS